MVDVGGRSESSPWYSVTHERSVSPSTPTARSVQTDDSVSTAMTDKTTDKSPVINPKFRASFSEIVQRWQNGILSKDDYSYLGTTSLSSQDYLLVSEEFNLRHGVELVNDHLRLYEYPTAIHEYMNRIMDEWVHTAYGRNIIKLGSTSNVILNMY
jgi:hypothetical protein